MINEREMDKVPSSTALNLIDSELHSALEAAIYARDALSKKLDSMLGGRDDESPEIAPGDAWPKGWPHNGQLGEIMRNVQNIKGVMATLLNHIERFEREV